MPPAIVIGFVGGFVRHDDLVHSEVQLAAHLRQDYSSGVYAQAADPPRLTLLLPTFAIVKSS